VSSSPSLASSLLVALLATAGLIATCGPAPPPAPPPTTTTTTQPAEPEPPCSRPGDVAPVPGPAGDYVGVLTRPPEHLEAMIAGREAIGRYRCWPSDPGVPLELLAAWLRTQGRCAARDKDRVFAWRSDKLAEEWHMARWDVGEYRGCWTSMDRAYLGTLAWIGAAR
jgi:hypothetical protein